MQRTPKGAPKRPQRTPKATKGPQMEPKGSPMDPKGSPKGSRKAPWSDPRIDPEREPAPEILISPKCCKNIINNVLLEPPEKPVLAREREARLNGENSQTMCTTTISEITYQQLLKIINKIILKRLKTYQND